MLTEFFTSLYNDEKSINETLPDWMFQEWHSAVLDLLSPLNGTLVRKTLAKFKDGKTCARDNVVTEMLTLLDEDFFEHLAGAFRLKLLNHRTDEQDQAWTELEITCILKRGKPPIAPSKLRPIIIIRDWEAVLSSAPAAKRTYY